LADKLTPLIVDALTRAAAQPAGVPLYPSKSEAGLFPSTAVARLAAKKAIDDGLITVVCGETRGKQTHEICIATEGGLKFLMDHVSPKQVLEDFVRLLEGRRDEVRELLATAARMAVGLERLTEVVSGVLPKIQETRVNGVHSRPIATTMANMEEPSYRLASRDVAAPSGPYTVATILTLPDRLALLEADSPDDLAEAVMSHLADWSTTESTAGDCPLPELFRSLTLRPEPPTIGGFHDCLRMLHDERRLYLHPWTGPLYALPEPQLALLVGHEVAYYASLRKLESWKVQS